MTRNRITTLAGLAAASALALALAGCKKDEEQKPGEPGAASPAPGAAEKPAAAVPQGQGFAVFPSASKVVLGVNFNQLRSSELWNMVKEQIATNPDASKGLAEFQAACGFDPLTQIQSVLVGGDPATEEMVFVVKGVDRGQAKTCLEKMAAKDGKQVAITDEGQLVKYSAEGKEAWAAWLDDSTVVIAPNKDKAFIEARAAGTAGLADNNDVMALLKNVDTGATLYIAATAEAAGGANPVAAMLPGAKGFFSSLRFGEGMDLDAGIRFDTPQNAQTGTTTVQGLMQQAKGAMPPDFASFAKMADKAQIKQNGNDMIVQIKLSGAEMKEIGTALQKMSQKFGNMGGM